MAFADTLGALATIANLKDRPGTTTIESKTNFIDARLSADLAVKIASSSKVSERRTSFPVVSYSKISSCASASRYATGGGRGGLGIPIQPTMSALTPEADK
jgi:hypothetical protein